MIYANIIKSCQVRVWSDFLIITFSTSELDLQNWLRDDPQSDLQPYKLPNLLCASCDVAADQIIKKVEGGGDPKEIAKMMIDICIKLKIANEVVCESIVPIIEVRRFAYILD